jgi:hypothetical protein
MSRNIGRLRYRKDDPLRYLHVPAGERQDTDDGDFSDATDEITGEPDDFDRDAVRARTRVAPEEDLQ